MTTVGTLSAIQDAMHILESGRCLSFTNSSIIPGQVLPSQGPGRGYLKEKDINGDQEVKNVSDSGLMHELNAGAGRKTCVISRPWLSRRQRHRLLFRTAYRSSQTSRTTNPRSGNVLPG